MWGLTVSSVGFQHIEAGVKYPPQNHPAHYLFSTKRGRVLNEYQLLYITHGKGVFESSNCKQTEIKEGNMFLLFPDEWHLYSPDAQTGWDEYWIGFKGVNMDNRCIQNFFSKQKPVFNIGINEEIVHLYKQALLAAEQQATGFQQLLAGIVNHLLGLAYSLNKHSSFEDLNVIRQINKSKVIMLEHLQEGITLEEVAQRVAMSYSWFRRIFKQYTGFSPHQYLLELKIQKAKDLLTTTNMSIKEIAFSAGFDNSEHFSSVFRNKTQLTPVSYRKLSRGHIG